MINSQSQYQISIFNSSYLTQDYGYHFGFSISIASKIEDCDPLFPFVKSYNLSLVTPETLNLFYVRRP
jgi:hypothetical protein